MAVRRVRATFSKAAPSGVGASVYNYPYEQAYQTSMKAFETKINEVMKVLSFDLRRALTKYIGDELIHLGYEILQDAVLHCPYKTGKLRSSGEVNLIYGSSRGGGVAIQAVLAEADSSGDFMVEKVAEGRATDSKALSIEIQFDRTGEDEEGRSLDIALWAHEQLLPYWGPTGMKAKVKGKYFARQPGTGPKYLQNAYNKQVGTVDRRIREGINRGLRFIAGRNKYLMEVGEI